MARIPIGFNSEAFMELIRSRVYEIVLESLGIVEEECKKTVPLDTGELRDSIHIEGPAWITIFHIEGKVIAGGKDVPQAYFMEFGTAAHGPVKAKAMHFFWKGDEIFAKWVRGCTPLHWMRNAANFSFPLVNKLFALLNKEFSGRAIIIVKMTSL